MLSFFKKKKKTLDAVAKQQLRENKKVIESLRDYDTGKKDISTRNVKRRLPHIRIAP